MVFRPAEPILHSTFTVILTVKLVFFEVYLLSNLVEKDDNHSNTVSLIIVLI